MATRLEQEYENTIQLYLENDYKIVSETENTTIMLSNDFITIAQTNAAFTGIGQAMSSKGVNAVNTAMNTSYSSSNIQKSNYEVAIRMTKTGKIQISGYALEKHQEYKSKVAKVGKKATKTTYYVGSIFGVIFTILGVFLLIGSDINLIGIIYFIIFSGLGLFLIFYCRKLRQ